MSGPSDKQSIRAVVVALFPFLAGFVTEVSARGRGLAIRAAGGLLHLAGGASDPAVHRVGDKGTAGSVEATPPGPAANTLTFTNADGTVAAFAFAVAAGQVVITPTVPTAFPLTTKAETGSTKVTCG